MSTVVKITNLIKEYQVDGKAVPVLQIPSLELASGQQVALVGASGSGKSTLLNIIAGLVAPTRGQVSVLNQDIYAMAESSRDLFRAANIGYIFQSFNLMPSLSAWENVALPMFLSQSKLKPKEQFQRSVELLEQVGLSQRIYHRPGQLSKGEQQRVAIARSLSTKASLVLADEPTGNLDLPRGQAMIQLIKELCQRHQTALLLVTHNPYVVETFSTVWQMDRLQGFSKGGAAQ